ncbi:hypothetical protein Tco_0406896 [Tanacetum coccineum]
MMRRSRSMNWIRNVVYEEEESAEDAVSTEDVFSTDKEKVSTDRSKVSTDRSRVSTDKEEVSTDRPDKGTDDQTKGRYDPQTPPTTTTPSIFGDDETIAQVLIIMSQNKEKLKEKGVEHKDVEETERPRPTSTRSLLTIKPLPKIDPKDKGKKKIEEEDESDMNLKAALSNEYDFIQARIEADRLLALRLQDEERKEFTKEERAKISFMIQLQLQEVLAEQRALSIGIDLLTKKELRSQMMTYLKHVGNKKHSDLKNKTFEEIQALYEKVKRFDESFTVIGSNEDERKIKEMNEGASDPDKKKKVVKEDVLTKVPAKQEVVDQGTKKRKGTIDSEIMERKGTIDSEIIERKSVIARLNTEIVRWRLYEAYGVYILELEDGTVIHMLVERSWLSPFSRLQDCSVWRSKVTTDPLKKLKGSILTPGEQEAADLCRSKEKHEDQQEVELGDVDDEGDDHINDIQDTDDKDDENEYDEYEIYNKADAEQRLQNTVKDTTDVEINSLLDLTPSDVLLDLEQESKKSPSEILKIKKEQAKKQKMPKFTIKSTDRANSQDCIEDENAMDKGVDDTVQDHKRKHDDDEDDDDDEDPPAGPN